MTERTEQECESRAAGSSGSQRDRGSLMNVGRRVEYAVRALCYLAAQPGGRAVPRTEIESHQGIPPHFLSKILRTLVAAGLLKSAPGVRGGFRLARPAAEISFRSIYEAIQGRLSFTECARRGADSCDFVAVCTQREIWLGAQRALAEYLDRVSIAEIADERGLVPRAAADRQRRTKPPLSGRASKPRRGEAGCAKRDEP